MKTLPVIFGVLTALSLHAADIPTNSPVARTNGTDLFADPLVAKGKNLEIKRSALDEAVVGIKANLATRGQSLPPERQKMLEQQILQRLIQIRLLNNKATDSDKAKGKEAGLKLYDTLEKRASSPDVFTRQLKAVGLTPESLKQRMAEEATSEAVVGRELKSEISDEQARKFYDENPSKFEQPEMVRASHILVATVDPITNKDLTDEKKKAKRKEIDDLRKRAVGGEDFAKLAKEFSEDPGSKDKGGEYTFGRGEMMPEFESAAFGLKTNEVSEVVTTPYGYHIIKLSEKIPARTEPFSESKPKIKEYLERTEIQKKFPDFIKKLEKEADLQILDPELKPPAEEDAVEPEATATPKSEKPPGK